MTIKTYKGMDKDMRCRWFQYEVGKTYETDKAKACESGFHACEAPLDVLRYYPLRNGNRYFEVEQDGEIDRNGEDSKVASTKITVGAEIGLPGLIKAHFEYTRKKAESGEKGGDNSNLAGGDRSNLAGGYGSNLAGGYGSNIAGGDCSNLAGGNESDLAGGDWSNLAGGNESNLAGGNWSNLAGGDCSNLAGGYRSNLAGGDRSNLAGGDCSNLAGGYRSNLAGGDRSNIAGGDCSNLAGGYGSNIAGGDCSNLAGGDRSLIVSRNDSKAQGGKNSVIVLTAWSWRGNEYVPVAVKSFIIDGENYKPDVWYTLKDGEIVEAK